MTKHYLKALKCRMHGQAMACELAGWLTGKDLYSLDCYDLAQMLWDIFVPSQDDTELLKLKQILLMKCDKSAIWDKELCMAMLAVICSKHNFEIEAI